MQNDELNIRIDELKRLKKVDCFNESYSTDVRCSKYVDIRIEQLTSELVDDMTLETWFDTREK